MAALVRAGPQPVASLRGHTDRVCSIAACDGDVFASGGRDRTIRLWSRKRGASIAELHGSDESVYSLAVRGDLLISGEGCSGCGRRGDRGLHR